MLGKAVANGQGGVEGEAGDHTAHQEEEENLQDQSHTVAHVIGGELLGHLLPEPSEGAEHLHVRRQGHKSQGIHHRGPQEPDGGDKQLRPHQGVGGHGQGEHHIALVGHQVAAEA